MVRVRVRGDGVVLGGGGEGCGVRGEGYFDRMKCVLLYNFESVHEV